MRKPGQTGLEIDSGNANENESENENENEKLDASEGDPLHVRLHRDPVPKNTKPTTTTIEIADTRGDRAERADRHYQLKR